MLYRCSLAVGGSQSVGMTDTVAPTRTLLDIGVGTCFSEGMSVPGVWHQCVADGERVRLVEKGRTRRRAVVETVMKQRCLVAQF